MEAKDSTNTSLPFRGIARRVKNGNNYNPVFFNREIDCIRKSFGKGAANCGPQFLVLEWTGRYSSISFPEFVQEFQTQSGLFILIPFEGRFDIGVDRWFR